MPPEIATALRATLDTRDADAFVHVGSLSDPAIRYCLTTAMNTDGVGARACAPGTYAVAFDGTTWVGYSNNNGQHPFTEAIGHTTDHPAVTLADELRQRLTAPDRRVIAPPHIPHDGALFLEQAGVTLASSTVVEELRATKRPAEQAALERAQAAGAAGIRRVGTLLERAHRDENTLVADGEPVTVGRVHRAINTGVVCHDHHDTVPVRTHVSSGPTGHRDTPETALSPGVSLVLAVEANTASGYHGSVTRTLVVDSDGGPERRANVALTHAFRSVTSLLTADCHTVSSAEAALEAEIRAFGFGDDDGIETCVSGIGLEPREPPLERDGDIDDWTAIRITASVETAVGPIVREDTLLRTPTGLKPLASLPHSLSPRAYQS